MNLEESDPDILQILDEADYSWVRHWRKALIRKTEKSDGWTLVVPLRDNVYSQMSRHKRPEHKAVTH